MDEGQVYQLWGYSPALDLAQVARRKTALQQPQQQQGVAESAVGEDAPLEALCMGSYDARHFLRTLCRAWRHPGQPVRVLSWDLDAAHVARHMLLLATALDFGLPRRERAQLLLELHGSCFLRERTAAYAEGRSKELLDVVAAASEGRRAAGVLGRLLDLSQLKFRERDDVADALRGLSRRVQFDMARAREHRQRRFLGERYDARDAAADWDYQMRWREVAPIVRARNFKGWRASGVAARLRDARYEQPNRSLAATAAGRAVEEYDRITGAPKGRSITKRGFWGDILTGPFAAFGVEADDPRLFETANKEHKHDEQAVAEHNLLQMLHELEEACEYAPPNPDEAFGGEGEGAEGGEQGDNSEEPSAVDIGDGDGDTATEPPAVAAAALARCLLTFVMGDPVKQIFGRAKYASHFHAVTLGCRDVHWPSHGLAKVVSPGGVVAVESGRHMVELKREHKAAFVDKVLQVAREGGLEGVDPYDSTADGPCLYLKLQPQSSA